MGHTGGCGPAASTIRRRWRSPWPATRARYRQPGERADRVAIEIAVDKVMCNSGL